MKGIFICRPDGTLVFSTPKKKKQAKAKKKILKETVTVKRPLKK